MVEIRVILYCGIFLASTVRDYWDIGYAAINLVSIICGTVSKFTNAFRLALKILQTKLIIFPFVGDTLQLSQRILRRYKLNYDTKK